MTRKESEKDSERPHYYSQFWLDVAAGRRVIGAPKPEDGESAETESEAEVESEPDPAPLRRARQSDAADSQIIHPVAEPVRAPQEFIEPDVADQDDITYQDDIVADDDIPDMDLITDEDEEAEIFDVDEEADEDDEDDDMNWGRGRKKAKPTRATKPVPKKPGKRDTRRGY
ncbi:hypothetical protein [Dictyobacter arantiisoli]|uniref:Uncharacterized protein n=1 Tax=Dictyobacter arantiisoli TaxID=2014874 RepID=A0A5A5TB65_9CHLR|nr:hypothetical protein [Dictyobacter arantiisoli]GCF08253.1 hypothetical protein KDI_18170 [Dictyobacter arantiisoli]